MPTPLNNQASISYTYDGAAAPEVANSNTTITTLLDEYSLLGTKNALVTTFRPGQQVSYVVRLENSGRGDLYNLTVTDNLGDTGIPTPLSYQTGSARLYINGTEVPITPTVGIDSIVCTYPGPFPAGSVALLVYTARVREDLGPNVNTITNTVFACAKGGSPSGALVYVSPNPYAVLVRESYADVSIYKQADKQNVVSGDTLTYTFTLTNRGDKDATGVVLQDALPSGFTVSSVSVENGGVVTNYEPGQYSIDPETNTITLPTSSGAPIVVPAATASGPSVVTIVVAGTVSL